MNSRLKEIDNILQSLHAERELLEAEIQSKNAQSFINILPRCQFVIDYALNIEIGVNDKDVDVFLKLIGSLGDGSYHFGVPLTAQINLRVDDGRYCLVFSPAHTDMERFKQENDTYFQFKQIVTFLKANGVKKSKFYYIPLTRNIKQLEAQVAKAKNDLKFVQENI